MDTKSFLRQAFHLNGYLEISLEQMERTGVTQSAMLNMLGAEFFVYSDTLGTCFYTNDLTLLLDRSCSKESVANTTTM